MGKALMNDLNKLKTENQIRNTGDTMSAREEELLLRAVRRINSKILGLVMGFMHGIGLFVATIWLVVKGGPIVGPHLSLLNQFFIGYKVTVGGAFIGFVYAFAYGYVVGYFIGKVYNWFVATREARRTGAGL